MYGHENMDAFLFSSELFTTVLDMMNVLVNSTLSSDPGASPGAGDESKQHQQLIKKLKVCKMFTCKLCK